MNTIQAAQTLQISGELTKELIKNAYRKACSKFHPDKGGCVEMMQLVNAAYEVLTDFEGPVEETDHSYSDALNEALKTVINLPNITIEICGNWIWITGNTKPHSKILGKSGAGFFWAPKKTAWYFRPDDYKSVSKGTMSLDEIRDKYNANAIKSVSQKYLGH